MTQDQTVTLSKNQCSRETIQIMGYNSVPQRHSEVLSSSPLGWLFSICTEMNCEKLCQLLRADFAVFKLVWIMELVEVQYLQMFQQTG